MQNFIHFKPVIPATLPLMSAYIVWGLNSGTAPIYRVLVKEIRWEAVFPMVDAAKTGTVLSSRMRQGAQELDTLALFPAAGLRHGPMRSSTLLSKQSVFPQPGIVPNTECVH
jgi:hypothetical protein